MVSVAQAALIELGRLDSGSWIFLAITGGQTSPHLLPSRDLMTTHVFEL